MSETEKDMQPTPSRNDILEYLDNKKINPFSSEVQEQQHLLNLLGLLQNDYLKIDNEIPKEEYDKFSELINKRLSILDALKDDDSVQELDTIS